jgi:hypothetical protein
MGCGSVAATVADFFVFASPLGVVCEAAGGVASRPCRLTGRNFEPARVRRGDIERTIGCAFVLPRFLPVSGCIAPGTAPGELGCSGLPAEEPDSSATLLSISVPRKVASKSSGTVSSTSCCARF